MVYVYTPLSSHQLFALVIESVKMRHVGLIHVPPHHESDSVMWQSGGASPGPPCAKTIIENEMITNNRNSAPVNVFLFIDHLTYTNGIAFMIEIILSTIPHIETMKRITIMIKITVTATI